MLLAHARSIFSIPKSLGPKKASAQKPRRACAAHGAKKGKIIFDTLFFYSSQLPTVRGKGMTSRMFPMPVRYMTQRSKPRPKPAWRAEP